MTLRGAMTLRRAFRAGVLAGFAALWCAATGTGALYLRDGRSRSLAERDGYYRQAKAMGFRARSAFKVSGRVLPERRPA